MLQGWRRRVVVVAGVLSIAIAAMSGGVAHATGDYGFGSLSVAQNSDGVYVHGEGVYGSTTVSVFDSGGNLIKTCGPPGSGQPECVYSYLTALAPLSGPLPVGTYTVDVVKIGYSAALTLVVSPPPPPAPPKPKPTPTPKPTPVPVPPSDPVPVNVTAPSLWTDRPTVGVPVTVIPGTWRKLSRSVVVMWHICPSGQVCHQVGYGPSYTPTLADLGGPLTASEYADYYKNGHLKDVMAVSRAAVVVLPPFHAGLNPLTTDASGAHVQGWACNEFGTSPLQVHVYVGGPAGTGTIVGIVNNDQPTEDAVNAICRTSSGTKHRFDFVIPNEVRLKYRSAPIYVYSFDVSGAPVLLAGSGAVNFTVPAAPLYGYVGPITMIAGFAHVRGWACTLGDTQLVSIRLMVGGVMVAAGYTDQPTGDDVNAACHTERHEARLRRGDPERRTGQPARSDVDRAGGRRLRHHREPAVGATIGRARLTPAARVSHIFQERNICGTPAE